MLAFLSWSSDAAAQAGRDTAADRRHRADCRLAHQVLTKGQPAVKREWALGKIRVCEELGGEALAAELRRHRQAESPTEALEEAVRATRDFVDARLAEVALDITSDPSAGTAARVQAIRVLSYQITPGSSASFEELTDPGEETFFHHHGAPVVGERLPEEFPRRIFETLADIHSDDGNPESLQNAASNVGLQVLLEKICPPEVESQACDRKFERLLANSGSS